MSSVTLKGFGDGHSQSPAKEMAQEKLSEVKMHSHLLTCFEKKQLTSFPNERRIAREKYLYFLMQEIELYRTCLMPETYGDMVQCDACEKWYHLRCVGLLEPPQEVD